MAVYIITSEAYADGRYKVGYTTETPHGLLSEYKRQLSEPVIKLFISTRHYKLVERSVLNELDLLRVPHDTGVMSEYVIWDYTRLMRLVLRTVDDFETPKSNLDELDLSVEQLEMMCKFFDIPMTDIRKSPQYYLDRLKDYKAKKMPSQGTIDYFGMFNRTVFTDSSSHKTPKAPKAPAKTPKVSTGNSFPVKKVPSRTTDKNVDPNDVVSTNTYLIGVLHELKKINPSFKLFYSSNRCTVGLDCGGKLLLAEFSELPMKYKEFTSGSDIYSTENRLPQYIKNQVKKILA